MRIFALALVAAGCGGYCEPGPLGTGLDCPSIVDEVSPSREHVVACGPDPLAEAATYWGVAVSESGARAELKYQRPGEAKHAAQSYYDLHYHRGRIQEIRGCTIITESCDPVILAHEIGHCLGYPDVDSPGSVMHWHTDGVGWDRP